MTVRIGLVWAEARGGVIGASGGMPWHVPEDLAHFKQVTSGAPVVMGRKTWESLPDRFRPLPGRRNIVVTRSPDWAEAGAERAESLADALERAVDASSPEWIWIIGGGELFRESIELADRLEVTELDLAVDGDTFAPGHEGFEVEATRPASGWETSVGGIPYRFVTYRRAT